ncbi:hypothetical protein L6452_02298 [Arctium lappa]|uniref:Uncharacterized protein n=1 Tax=Arctium lappa TaxID=4217 RepID=A0ACB9FJV1_ARCLA|nr:hypothetical protein L6452_02298 [Arctium lappa]
MKKNSFSNYMNTADNPLDEDGNEIGPKSKGSTSNNPPVVKKLIEVNKQGSTEGNNEIGVKVELRNQPPLTVSSDVEIEKASKLRITKDASMEDDDFMSIPRPVPTSSTIILDSDKPIPRKITKRIVEGMKGITLNEGLKERIDGTRGRLRNNDTKEKDQMKRANEFVLDAGIEDGVRIPKRELLYVERTTLPNISVEHIRPATRAWNVEWLKKREIAEIENGGLRTAPLRERTQDQAINNDEFTPLHDDTVEKGLDELEHEREVMYDETVAETFSSDILSVIEDSPVCVCLGYIFSAMDYEYEIVGKCIQGVGMDNIDDCRSSDVDVVGNNPDLAISEELKDGVSKPVDVYRVDGCFVPDVYRVDGFNVDYDSVV